MASRSIQASAKKVFDGMRSGMVYQLQQAYESQTTPAEVLEDLPETTWSCYQTG